MTEDYAGAAVAIELAGLAAKEKVEAIVMAVLERWLTPSDATIETGAEEIERAMPGIQPEAARTLARDVWTRMLVAIREP